MVRPAGFEPAAYGFVDLHIIEPSYRVLVKSTPNENQSLEDGVSFS